MICTAPLPQMASPALCRCCRPAQPSSQPCKIRSPAGRIGHAYLFTGTRGTGKTTCAKIFAKAVNCLPIQEGGDPCGECDICRGIDYGAVWTLWRWTPPPTTA